MAQVDFPTRAAWKVDNEALAREEVVAVRQRTSRGRQAPDIDEALSAVGAGAHRGSTRGPQSPKVFASMICSSIGSCSLDSSRLFFRIDIELI